MRIQDGYISSYNFGVLLSPMLPDKLVFVDTETTGLSAVRDRIIEIGMLRIDKGKVVDTYQTLINPQMRIDPFIESLTGISKESLESAPVFEDIKGKIAEMTDGAVFVAHNVRFDYSFLKNEFRRCELSFSPKHFCTARLSRTLFPEERHHNLDSIITKYGFSVEKRHRAFDDAKVLWDFYQVLLKRIPLEQLEKAVLRGMKKPSLPQGLDQTTVANLPEAPGVYLFYGENELPLYVGKSVNIKDRVLSHFANDHASGKEMQLSQQVKRIDSIQTCGELGALIKESQLIKQLQPLYNRQLRMSRKLIKLSHTINDAGYEEIVMDTVTSLYPDDIASLIGIFKSQRQAKEFLIKLAKDYNLCEKYLGLEHPTKECFAYRLQKCNGACINKELPIAYNFRFLNAFTKYKLKSWPFDGPIAITEKSENHTAEQFIIDKWCVIGHKTSEYDETIVDDNPQFDVDMYKILLRFLEHTSPRKFTVEQVRSY